MENEIFTPTARAVRNWWESLLVGILSLIVGIWCLFTPDRTLVALTMVFVVAFLVSGVFDILFAVSNRDLQGWGWTLAGGILDILLSVLLLSFPFPVITLILIYFVGFWLLIRSIWSIGMASELSRLKGSGWGWLLTLAILGVLCSFLFFLSPVFGGGVIVWLASFAFVLYGVFRIYLAFRLKEIRKYYTFAEAA